MTINVTAAEIGHCFMRPNRLPRRLFLAKTDKPQWRNAAAKE